MTQIKTTGIRAYVRPNLQNTDSKCVISYFSKLYFWKYFWASETANSRFLRTVKGLFVQALAETSKAGPKELRLAGRIAQQTRMNYQHAFLRVCRTKSCTRFSEKRRSESFPIKEVLMESRSGKKLSQQRSKNSLPASLSCNSKRYQTNTFLLFKIKNIVRVEVYEMVVTGYPPPYSHCFCDS